MSFDAQGEVELILDGQVAGVSSNAGGMRLSFATNKRRTVRGAPASAAPGWRCRMKKRRTLKIVKERPK